jgi:hypothetical protein
MTVGIIILQDTVLLLENTGGDIPQTMEMNVVLIVGL